MELSHDRPAQPYGLLYPMMLIAAIAVIVFSILGIVSIAGWMPNALSATHRDANRSLRATPAKAPLCRCRYAALRRSSARSAG